MLIPIFVLHCKIGLEERRKSIETQMSKLGLHFEFILNNDRNELEPEQCRRYFSSSYPANLMSLSLKHREAMRRIVEEKHNIGLILEDDVILEASFLEKLDKVLKESSQIESPHVIYLSNYGNRYTPRSRIKKNQVLYRNTESRACDSYLITLEACRRRLDWWDSNVFTLPIDHQVNLIDTKLGIETFWAEPNLIEQGSENGVFNTSIGTDHGSWLKPIRWKLDKFYKKHILRNLR